MAVKFTEAAVKKLLDTRKGQGGGVAVDSPVRLSIKGGGCAGFTYVIDFDEAGKKELDNEFSFEADGESLTVLVDPKSYLMINGTEVDFINTLMEQRFSFTNPNAQGSCGCGTSFAV